MELKDFIRDALLNVTKGVEEANQKEDRFRLSGHKHANGESGQKIEFDVSITVNEASEKGIDGGIKVAILNLGGVGKNTESNQSLHKIKFDVFISEK